MGDNNYFANIPKGKDDKPFILSNRSLIYDINDIDGLYTMLDKDFSGCVLLTFSKPMDNKVKGVVKLEDRIVDSYYLKQVPIMANMWVLAVKVRGLISEYGEKYTLHIEGFYDTDGNEMEPQEITIESTKKAFPEKDYRKNEKIALLAAKEGIVLLKNDNNVLPILDKETFNLFGKGIWQFRTGAVGAGKINPRYIIDFKRAIRESEQYELNEELVDFYKCDNDLIPDESILSSAKNISDKAIMMITRESGENLDNSTEKGEYYLTQKEERLLQVLSDTFKELIVVLNVSYPIDVTFIEKYNVDAVIYLGLAGMQAGKALLDVMSGETTPSGKLPDTWAKDYKDIPSSFNFYDSVSKKRLDADSGVFVDTCYEEDIYVGYRYFTTFNKEVSYPFGYGLSYTKFDIKYDDIYFDLEEGLKISCNITNIGDFSGKEVIQIYVGQPDTKIEKPTKILVDFEKTKELKPRQEQVLEFKIDKKYMVSYDEENSRYVLEKGEYIVFAGKDVLAPEVFKFEVKKTVIVKQVENLMKPNLALTYLSKNDIENTWPKGEKSGIKEGREDFLPKRNTKYYPPKFNGNKPKEIITYKDVKKNNSLAEDFVAQMNTEELARIAVCGSAGWGMEGIGEAGHIVKLEKYKMPDFLMSDGNSGVNVKVKNIGMPSGVTICASFNKKLANEVGRVIGEEAKELGIAMILAPAINIHRNPLNGRQPEYFSEDPILAGKMSGYYTKGLEETGIAGSMKHLVANNCETSRKRNMSILSERALREIYYRAFEIAMDIHMPASIMTAYNACNGVPTAADSELLLGVLRKECGFDGFIMTDWNSYDSVDIKKMVQAGNCFITPGSLDNKYTSEIIEGIKNKEIELERLQENVTWIIKTMIKFV